LLKNGKTEAEFDLLYVSEQRMYAGECKAKGELADKDIETARIAETLGISIFYYCTTGRWSENSRDRVSALTAELGAAGSKMEILTLNGDDLLGDAFA
jgi:hypothetical protein